MNHTRTAQVSGKRKATIPLQSVALGAVLLASSVTRAQFVDPPEPGHICVNCGGGTGRSSGESPAQRARERQEREEEWKRKQAELERKRQAEERRQAERERQRRWKEAQHGIIAIPAATVVKTSAPAPIPSAEFFGIRNDLSPTDMPALYINEKKTDRSGIPSENLRRAAAILKAMCPRATTDERCAPSGSAEDAWFLSDQLGRALAGESLAVQVQPVHVTNESDLRAALGDVNRTMDELQALDQGLNDTYWQLEISRTAGDANAVSSLRKQYQKQSETRKKKLDELKKAEEKVVVIIQMLPAR